MKKIYSHVESRKRQKFIVHKKVLKTMARGLLRRKFQNCITAKLNRITSLNCLLSYSLCVLFFRQKLKMWAASTWSWILCQVKLFINLSKTSSIAIVIGLWLWENISMLEIICESPLLRYNSTEIMRRILNFEWELITHILLLF